MLAKIKGVAIPGYNRKFDAWWSDRQGETKCQRTTYIEAESSEVARFPEDNVPEPDPKAGSETGRSGTR